MAQFNLKQLYAASFGGFINTGLVVPGLDDQIRVNAKNIDAGISAGGTQAVALRTSALGTPIYMPVQINGVYLPNEPLITIEGEMEIITEPKAAGKGSFKEIMGLNDYEIQIYGICINEDAIDDYPEQQVSELRNAFENQLTVGALPIQSPLMRIFGIDHIVIKKFRIAPGYGEFSYQPYEIQCLSDEPVEWSFLNNPV